MNPILIQSKYFTLQSIWLFFAIGLFTTIYTIIRLSVNNGLKVQFLTENIGKLALFTLLGSRIAYVIENYFNYFTNTSVNSVLSIFYVWDFKFSLWGGLIAFVITFYQICKKQEQNFWKWLDILTPAFLVGIAIGHIGAFFDGSNYGNESSLPWSVNFGNPAIKYTVPIHPTQIYAFLYTALLAFISIFGLTHFPKVRNNIAEKPGLMGLLLVAAYTFFRFLEGFVRGDDVLMLFNIRLPQATALLIAISTGILIFIRYNKRNKKRR